MVRILWSGLSGRVGAEALEFAKNRNDVKIVAGMSRKEQKSGGSGVKWYKYGDLTSAEDSCEAELKCRRKSCVKFDVLVAFSHPEALAQEIRVAMSWRVPLIVGTSRLDSGHLKQLFEATKVIPVFYSANFQMKVFDFIDKAVKMVRSARGSVTLYEKLSRDLRSPSEIARLIYWQIMAKTDFAIEVRSEQVHGAGSMVWDWRLCEERMIAPERRRNSVRCSVVGLRGLVQDVMKIATIMTEKPAKVGFYSLEDVWREM